MTGDGSKYLDHLLVAQIDLPHARAQYQRLGFYVQPITKHQEIGSSNCIIQFDGTYYELLGDCDKMVNPDFRTYYADRLAIGSGLGNLSFNTTSVHDERARLTEQGVPTKAPLNATRAVTMPDGSTAHTNSFSMYTVNEARPYLAPFFSEHRKPETIFIPEFRKHENTVEKIVGVTCVSADPAEDVKNHSLFSGSDDIENHTHGAKTHLGKGHFIDFLTPDGATALYGDAAHFDMRAGGMGIGVTMKAKDVNKAAETLRQSGVSFTEHGDTVLVPHQEAGGVMLQWVGP